MSEPTTAAGRKIVDLGVRLRDTEETIALVLAIEAETLKKAVGRIEALPQFLTMHDEAPEASLIGRDAVLAALCAEGEK